MGSAERRKVFITMDHTAIWLALLIAIITYTTPATSSEPRVVCYYTNWSVYRPGTARFNPQNINPYLCTHLIYAFGGFTKDNAFKPFDKYQDIEKGGYAKFTGLKTYNKNLKTLLAIGGWNEGSSRFSPMVASREHRKEFVRNAIKFLRQNRFDGLDLDWEYPAFRDGSKPKDRENYAKLVKELREEFDRESEKTGRPRLLLTMAVPAGIEYVQKGFDVKTLNQYLDWMNLLTYDYHSAFEPAVNHHAPLYPLEEPNEYSVDNELNIDYTIKFYLENGADRDKLVLGIPTYGRSYTLFNPDATEIGAPADGPGDQGDATREKGYLAYYEICEALKPKEKKRSADSDDEDSDDDEEEVLPWTVEHPNPKAMGPFAFRGNQWVGYDDIDIVKKKAEYVAENGLGGIMFWSIDNDDFRGTCHGKPYPLIESAKEAYIGRLGSSDNEVVTSRATTSASSRRRNRPRTTTVRATTAAAAAVKSQSNKRKSSTSAVSTTTPSWHVITPEPPTTPDPGSDFKCTDEGFFPHPRDCKKYFWCLDSGPSNLGIVAHHFTCPSGLFFNKAADSCDFARNVICKKPAATTTTSTTARPTTTTETYTTRRPVKLSTKSAAAFRTTTTTTTTTPPPEEEYEDEITDDGSSDIDAEDPKVIKELIDLIKKVGGVEQLEKQLHLSGTDGATTTAAPFNKKLYQKVLERTRASNKFSGNSLSDGTSQNSRRGPQSAGIDAAELKSSKKETRPQYTTINRSRQLSTTEEPASEEEEEDAELEAEEEPTKLENRPREDGTTAKPLQYVNIRRAKPSTSDTADDTASRNALFERSEPAPESVLDAGPRRDSTPDYVTIRRQRPTTEEATTVQYQPTESDESSYETLLEKEISSPPSQPQYSSIERRRPITLPPEQPESPEPTTVLAVQISSLLNAPSPDEPTSADVVVETEVTDPTTTTTTTTAAPRRRSSTTPAPAPSSTTAQAQKDRRNNFLRRTKATAPPIDATESSITEKSIADTTTSIAKYTRRGNNKFKTQTRKKETKEAEKDGGKIENRTRPPSLSSTKRSERPTRTYVRRRYGGANATTSSTTPIPASSSTRRPFRVVNRRRLPSTLSSTTTTTTTTPEVSSKTTVTTNATEALTTGTVGTTTTSTTTTSTTTLASEEELQDIEVRDSIEDPALRPRLADNKKTVKVQRRRPLTSLKEPFDQNPSATNEDRHGQTKEPPVKEDERKRQSKKYSASFKQNQLDEVLRRKSQEDVTGTTQSGFGDDTSAETAVAIAAHQLLSAPLPIGDSYAEQAKTNTKKAALKPNFYPTTDEYKYTTNTDYSNEDIPRRQYSTPGPIYRGSSYSTIQDYQSAPSFASSVIPVSGYSSGISKTSGYSSTPSYSSTSRLPYPTSQRSSGFTTAGFLSGGFSISPALDSSTARYMETSNKYVTVPADQFRLSEEPVYFTRDYLLESPVTRTYDENYQYLSPVTTEPTTRKSLPRKTVYRKISTTVGPAEPLLSTTPIPKRIVQILSTTPKPKRVVQRKKAFEKLSKVAEVPNRTYRPIENYDYYDDSNEKLVNKAEAQVIVRGKGRIECLDIGNFPHPTSCKKFISCARMEGGTIVGWEYICPEGLSFDPVGGICNWSAGLGCEEH